MNHSTLNILDLPVEILLIILNKLSNIDVLYSLIEVNQRLDKLAQNITFTRSVDLVTISSNENNDSILDRFCSSIIPRIQHNIEYLIVGPLSTDRILRIGNYSKLHKLTLVNLPFKMASRIFNNGPLFVHSFKHQISHLIVTINDDNTAIRIRNLTTNVFVNILVMFTNLTHLELKLDDNVVYPPLSLIDLPSKTCYSSSVVHLNVRVRNFDDCLCLLDGRLSQLHTFIVEVDNLDDLSMAIHNKRTLSNLKCFSLSSTDRTDKYDIGIVPLLRQMSQLKKLTLSIIVLNRTSFLDGNQLHKYILCKMPHLHTFIFNIITKNVNNNQELLRSCDNIKRTFIKRGYNVDCYIDRYSREVNQCHVYSLPFTMTSMCHVSNNFPGGLFMSVRKLRLYEFFVPFEHDFFVRISRAFPLLSILNIINTHGQRKKLTRQQDQDKETSSTIEYPHLTYLSLHRIHIDYMKQFLFESNTRLPSLNKLSALYEDLRNVTDNFTSDAARVNCAKLKYIILCSKPTIYPENFHDYFPSLVNKSLL